MLISAEEEQVPLTRENGGEVMKPVPMDPDLNSVHGLSSVSTFCGFTGDFSGNFPEANLVPENDEFQLVHHMKNLEDEVESLKLKEKDANEKRRTVLNKILDIKGSIRVFCRIRPFQQTKRKMQQPISINSDKILINALGIRKEFGFDKVFSQDASQEDVFLEVEPILRSALDGHNACILAYGQTGTGKTYTMDGTTEAPGIIPRVLKNLFNQASLYSDTAFTFSISMVEVYLGSLRDLLAPKPSSRTYAVSKCNPTIQIDSKGSVEIEGLTEVPVSNFTKATWWYSKGKRCRSTSWTNVNESSSRSHCLMRITISLLDDASGGKTEVSKLWMVDLGGSERLLKTGATGQTLDEGRAINLSLSALGDVIAALRRKKLHVPYRNSKLTQILRDSLGNGSKVIMLVHVSPYEEDVAETICSAGFAKRARGVDCTRELPEELKKQKEKKISELEHEMMEAEDECQKLQKQILKAALLLSESRKLLSLTADLEDEKKLNSSPKMLNFESLETPKASEKPVKKISVNSFHRFMGSTVASRQRKCIAEAEIQRRTRNFRSETRSCNQISASQAISYSDPRFKMVPKMSNKKPRYSEVNASSLGEAKMVHLNLDSRPMSRGSVVISSDSHPKLSLSRHRRRMSDMI